MIKTWGSEQHFSPNGTKVWLEYNSRPVSIKHVFLLNGVCCLWISVLADHKFWCATEKPEAVISCGAEGFNSWLHSPFYFLDLFFYRVNLVLKTSVKSLHFPLCVQSIASVVTEKLSSLTAAEGFPSLFLIAPVPGPAAHMEVREPKIEILYTILKVISVFAQCSTLWHPHCIVQKSLEALTLGGFGSCDHCCLFSFARDCRPRLVINAHVYV